MSNPTAAQVRETIAHVATLAEIVENDSTVTEAERVRGARVATARTLRQYRGTGYYPVTVGGYIVGHVQKSDQGWRGFDSNGNQVFSKAYILKSVADQAFQSRNSAVALIGRSDEGVYAYRVAAEEGTFGTQEQAEERTRQAAVVAELDADQGITENAELADILGDDFPQETRAGLRVAITDLRPGDRILEIDGETLDVPEEVVEAATSIYGDHGPQAVRLAGSKTTARYLPVDHTDQLVRVDRDPETLHG